MKRKCKNREMLDVMMPLVLRTKKVDITLAKKHQRPDLANKRLPSRLQARRR